MLSRAPRRAVRLLVVAAAALALSGLLAACGDVSWAPPPTQVAPSGEPTVQDRTGASFTRISVNAPVVVTVGRADEPSVVVEAAPNIQALIVTEVVDGQLVISVAAPGFPATNTPPKVKIEAAEITSLAIAGFSTATLESMVDELNLDVAGGSILTAIGQARKIALRMSAGSHAELAELPATDAFINLTDGSAATMTIAGAVTGVANGGSTLTLTAAPASQTVEVAGGGSVLVP